ncbi:FAD-dependent oxidoreductase [Paenibacillus glycanilyticus]|uniref:FAD-dependent oxidoreductase n=1 Tax=Paenibacillus glycanilyticus TaxID=126569 RepID=UPI00203AA210|nr:FAD-dependent oxidoreductase [Paenibacillus glycanilyticus]MCM3626832.1 FAD-dependent oxidoreductase [Paenibacillus glycanilyticus]
MREETVKSDITVVGGGLAGVCAAIAAARLGQTVSLVQNRPVLGGNSSSEVRVWVCGATGHGNNRHARETGIMGELFVENQYRNKEGNPYLWDLVVLEKVRAESNITLFLNTDVHEAVADGDKENRVIRSATGWMMGSERRIRFESEYYLDCTGDGLLGFLAGAEFRIGREARSEFGEDWAPEKADDITLGSTILFYTKDAGRPVKYIAPSFAKDIAKTTIPMKRVIRSGDSGCHYWWIEFGGELDAVTDNEAIRDELWSVIYGVWDYIKNSGKFDADNMTLEWIGALPGKREYRRFVGDYILNQNDIIAQSRFEDGVAFGGWSIDLHPPKGMYSLEGGSKHLHPDGVYTIPFRSLYSRNVSNLLFAGRNISASHVAFGTTRVMGTCAVVGEAAGTGAALCVQKGVTPRSLYREHLQDLRQTLLRQDASVIGYANEDEKDLARKARLSASSELKQLALEPGENVYQLDKDIAIVVPLDPGMDAISFLINSEEATELTAELWDTGREERYIPNKQQALSTVKVEAGQEQWVRFPISWHPDRPQNGFVILRENPHVSVHMAAGPQTGLIMLENKGREQTNPDPVMVWLQRHVFRKLPALRIEPQTSAFSAEKAIDGMVRPYGGPHMWLSGRMQEGKEEWIQLSWPAAIAAGEIHVTFNDDVNEDLINLHHHETPFEVMPELVKDYRVEALNGGEWVEVARGQNNRVRKVVHVLSGQIVTDQIRLVVESTNGSPFAEIVELRVYEA